MILTVTVLLSGLAGIFLLSLAEQRVEEVAAERPSPWPAWSRYLLIGGMLLCSGAMAVFLDRFYGADTLTIVNILLLCSVLWPCAWADAQAKVIPNRVLLVGLIFRAGVLGWELAFCPEDIFVDLARSVVAAGALGLVTVLCRLVIPKSIGFGDMKLLMLMGLYLGTDRIGGSIFCTMAVSFVYSLYLVLAKRANMKTELPYAPLLLIGTVLATFLIDV